MADLTKDKVKVLYCALEMPPKSNGRDYESFFNAAEDEHLAWKSLEV